MYRLTFLSRFASPFFLSSLLPRPAIFLYSTDTFFPVKRCQESEKTPNYKPLQKLLTIFPTFP